MEENASNTYLPADASAENIPPRTESEILKDCLSEEDAKRFAACFCGLPPDAPEKLVRERLNMNLLKSLYFEFFGDDDIAKATPEQIGFCIKKIKEMDNLKNVKP